MPFTKPVRIKTISELHRLRGMPQPEHPLINVVDYAAMTPGKHPPTIMDFYSAAQRRGVGEIVLGATAI